MRCAISSTRLPTENPSQASGRLRAVSFDTNYAILCQMASNTSFQIDGRIQRSERSREAIVQALLDLIGEGTLAPTAQRVAERAAVGVRTVFRHFSDMETLYAAMDERLVEQVDPLFVKEKQTGPISKRVDALIERRAEIFELIEPYRRAQEIQRWHSPFLQERHDIAIKTLRLDLGRWLPEISDMDNEIALALDLTLSFESWIRLRSDQGLGARRARNVLQRIVNALLSASER